MSESLAAAQLGGVGAATLEHGGALLGGELVLRHRDRAVEAVAPPHLTRRDGCALLADPAC